MRKFTLVTKKNLQIFKKLEVETAKIEDNASDRIRLDDLLVSHFTRQVSVYPFDVWRENRLC